MQLWNDGMNVGMGAAVMLCMGSCVRFPLPYNLVFVLKEGWSLAPTACPTTACPLYFSLFFGGCSSNFVLYKCEFT